MVGCVGDFLLFCPLCFRLNGQDFTFHRRGTCVARYFRVREVVGRLSNAVNGSFMSYRGLPTSAKYLGFGANDEDFPTGSCSVQANVEVRQCIGVVSLFAYPMDFRVAVWCQWGYLVEGGLFLGVRFVMERRRGQLLWACVFEEYSGRRLGFAKLCSPIVLRIR